MKRLAYALLIAVSFVPLGVAAQGISLLQQFTSTTSPASAITQTVFGKAFRLTGQGSGCAQFSSNGTLTSTGVNCGSGSGGNLFGQAWEIVSGFLTPTTTVPVKINATTTLATTTTSVLNGVIVVDGFFFPKTGEGIQTAENLCSLLSIVHLCGEVYLPAGEYNTTATIHLKSNVTLSGSGIGHTIIKGAATTYTLVDTVRSGTSKTVYNNIGLHDLSILSQSEAIIEFNNTNQLSIHNTEVSYNVTTPVSESFNIVYSQNVDVHDNYLHDITGNGIQINATDYFTVANNIINGVVGTDTDCIDIDTDFQATKAIPSNYGTVTGNVMHNCVNGTRVENGGNIVVANNTISSSTNSGIYLNTSDGLALQHVTVSGNNISSSTYAGISIVGDRTDDINIVGNTVNNSGYAGGSNIRAGIQIAAASTTVSNNYIYNSGGTDANGGGIVLYKKSNISLLNNTIASSTRGITFWDGSCAETYSNVVASGNKFNANGTNYGNDCGVLSQVGTGIYVDGVVFNSTGLVSNFGIATTSPGSLFSIGGVANLTTATSTFYGTGGVNLAAGCYAIGGICISSGSSLTGSTGQTAYFSSSNTAVGTSTLTFGTNSTISMTNNASALVATFLNIADASTVGGNQSFKLTSARGGGVEAARIVMNGGGDGLVIDQNSGGRALFIDQDDTGTGKSLEIDRDGNNSAAIAGLWVNVANAGAGAANAAIFEAGNVGIGTTSPAAKLDVYSSVASTTPLLLESVSGGGCIIIKDVAGTGYTQLYTQAGVVSAKVHTGSLATCN